MSSRRTERPATRDPMRDIDLLLLEELMMFRNSNVDVPVYARAPQTLGLLIVLVYALSRGHPEVAAAPPSETVDTASGDMGLLNGMP